MSWGTAGWGYTPWGGGVPSAIAGAGVHSVYFFSPTYIRIQLNNSVVAIGSYLDTSNYIIDLSPDSKVPGDPVRVLRVLPPTQDVLVVSHVYLETTPHTNGADYTATFGTLQSPSGLTVYAQSAPVPYASRGTKPMNILNNIPSHLDKRVDSLLHAICSAIGEQDDKIGGSRSDRFP